METSAIDDAVSEDDVSRCSLYQLRNGRRLRNLEGATTLGAHRICPSSILEGRHCISVLAEKLCQKLENLEAILWRGERHRKLSSENI